MDLDTIYASHPLSERTILARLERQGTPRSGLREWALAVDPETEITDQNHIGGVQAVLALAVAAHVSTTSHVVEVGSGLGGSARVLAQAFGCSVVGIEQDECRYEGAIRLTDLVGLSSRVRFLRHDALTAAAGIEHGTVDVLWGQGAWAHFPSPERFLDLWLPVLKIGGRVAVSDAFLTREPVRADESDAVRDLDRLWSAHLMTLDRWRCALEARGCVVHHCRDWTGEARIHFANLLSASSRWPREDLTAAERDGWLHASVLLERSLICEAQLVAVKSARIA